MTPALLPLQPIHFSLYGRSRFAIIVNNLWTKSNQLCLWQILISTDQELIFNDTQIRVLSTSTWPAWISHRLLTKNYNEWIVWGHCTCVHANKPDTGLDFNCGHQRWAHGFPPRHDLVRTQLVVEERSECVQCQGHLRRPVRDNRI